MITFDEVKRLKLNPGDILVLEADQDLDRQEIEEIKRSVIERFPDNECMVLCGGLHLEAVLHGQPTNLSTQPVAPKS